MRSAPPALRRLADREYVLVQEVRATRGPASGAVYDLQDAFFCPSPALPMSNGPGRTCGILPEKGPRRYAIDEVKSS
jgi:hypothetical protein